MGSPDRVAVVKLDCVWSKAMREARQRRGGFIRSVNYVDATTVHWRCYRGKIRSEPGGADDGVGPTAKARRNVPLILIPSGAHHLHAPRPARRKYVRRKFGLMQPGPGNFVPLGNETRSETNGDRRFFANVVSISLPGSSKNRLDSTKVRN